MPDSISKAKVKSVNGQIGTVVLDQDDINDTATYIRMLIAERDKLNDIEDDATGDQTGAEIKTLYEAEVKAFTNSLFDKLATIEPNAKDDQTAGEIEAIVSHNLLLDWSINQHRVLNDAGSTTIELFSASKILNLIAAVTNGLIVKKSADTCTTGLGNILLTGEQTLNGLTTSNSDVIVYENTDASENGIWVTSSGAWSRRDDAETNGQLRNGNLIYVNNELSDCHGDRYMITTEDPIDIGVDDIDFEQTPVYDFGTTSNTMCEGNDSRLLSQDENDAALGTNGTPSSVNKFVTNSDPRNTNNRDPNAHTHPASEITDFDTEVANNIVVASNFSIINSNLLTAWLSGCQVTVVGGSPELVNIAAGEIYVTELNGAVGSTGEVVTVPALNNVPHPATALSIIVIDSNGDAAISPFTGHLTQEQKRSGLVQIKLLSHLAGLTSTPIDETFTTMSALYGDSPAINDKFFLDGVVRQEGLSLIRNANLTIGRTAGFEDSPFAPDVFLTPNNPRRVVYAEESQHNFFLSWMGNDVNSLNLTGLIDDINPNNWDDPSLATQTGNPAGTLTGTKAQNFAMIEARGDTTTRIGFQYGRELYDNVDAAKAGAVAEMGRINHLLVQGSSSRGMLSVPRAATNLFTQALFTPPVSRNVSTLRGIA